MIIEIKTENYNFTVGQAINDIAEHIHTGNISAGWWNDKDGNDIRLNPYTFSNKLMLSVSELAEAMEGDRKGLQDDHLPSRPMREVELADAIIRILDLAKAYNLDIGGAVEEKLAYNAVRKDHKKESRESAGGKTY